MSTQPRVLLSAYQCGPGMGSVSQIGWEWYSRLSARVPVTLVTHVRNRTALEAAGAPLSGTEIEYVDTEWFAGPLYRLASKLFPKSQHCVFMISSADFYVYDRSARKALKARQRNGDSWDIIHAATPVSSLGATRLYRLGLPMVLGPLNSGLKSPSGFPELLSADSPWLYPIRNFGRLIEVFRGSLRNARMILSATRATQESLPTGSRDKCVDLLENGVDLSRFTAADWPTPASATDPLRLVFVGRLVPFKGIPLLLKALSNLRGEFPFEFRVVGDGPMRWEWEKQARQLELDENSVKFVGGLPLDEVPEQMRWAHAFCLPSVRESGGAVLIESMSCARPVIAVDYGGPGEL
ncbi:MAG: glycosyltransferase, partial [Planctomycetota bacterium]